MQGSVLIYQWCLGTKKKTTLRAIIFPQRLAFIHFEHDGIVCVSPRKRQTMRIHKLVVDQLYCKQILLFGGEMEVFDSQEL